jgi:hydroxymethylglutaryl-CoA lyase
VHREAGLPTRVTVCEVGPRDGLQNEAAIVPTEVKTAFIAHLVDAGLTVVEATSFVRPDWVPQLADAEQVVADLPRAAHPDVRFPVLVPNERGLDRALALGVRDVAVFASATETFSQRNLNRGRVQAREALAPVVSRARNDGVHVRGYLSMCFGDPWEGAVPVEQVVDEGLALLDLGCDQLSLGDTIGVAHPADIAALLGEFSQKERAGLTLHLHDTFGRAADCVRVALEMGVRSFDGSAGSGRAVKR